MKGRFYIAILCGLVVGLLCVQSEVMAAKTSLQIRTVALMPFGDFTVDGLSIDMTRLVVEELKRHQLDVIAQEVLEDFLAKRRVRRAEFLDRPTIRAMGASLNVDALVMGTVSMLSGGENPHVSVSAQMVDCENAAIVWADSVSRTGADYAGFLGLGRITSLEKLVNVVVGELFESLPVKVASLNRFPPSFEVVRAGFFPDALRSGETAQVTMEIKEIMGKVRDIKAFVMDNEITLYSRDGRFYGGTATAPPIEGTYPLAVYITDRWNRLFSMDALASMTVHNTPPKIVLTPRQKIVSPNNDGIKDFVLFVPEVLEAIALKSWKVEIADEEGQVVRSESGVEGLPQAFMWRGVDDQNRPVKDGAYFCRLVAQDEAGNTTTALSEGVVVDGTAPEAVVHIRAEVDEGMVLSITAKDRSKIDYWELSVLDASGREVDRFEGKGELPETVTADIKKKDRWNQDLMTRKGCLPIPWISSIWLGIGC